MIKTNLKLTVKTLITSFLVVVSVSSFAGMFPYYKAPSDKGKTQEDGKNYEITQNNKYLILKEKELDETYDFVKLSTNEILPPVIVCKDKFGNKITNFEFSKYKEVICVIVQPATSLYTDKKNKIPLSWKDFLIVQAPINNEAYETNNFLSGVSNAQQEFSRNLQRLHKIYMGMLTYKVLEKNGLVKLIKENPNE